MLPIFNIVIILNIHRIYKADENLRNFRDPVDIKGVTGPQHGSFMRLTEEEYKNLKKWSDSQK